MKRIISINVCLIVLIFLGTIIGCGRNVKDLEQQDEASPQLITRHIRLEPNDLLNYERSLQGLLGTKIDKQRITILVEKSEYRLTILYDGEPIKQYPIVLGGNPIDDKLRQGDGCTPEGMFIIQDLYPHETFSKFLYLNYPNYDSWAKHNQAIKEGEIPADSAIGGDIGIHGSAEDSQVERMENWTGGCIALKKIGREHG